MSLRLILCDVMVCHTLSLELTLRPALSLPIYGITAFRNRYQERDLYTDRRLSTIEKGHNSPTAQAAKARPSVTEAFIWSLPR